MSRSRRTKGAGRPPRDAIKLTDLQKSLLAIGKEELPMKVNGQTRTMTMAEALQRKQAETAFKGSPHAQGRILEALDVAQQTEAEERAAEVAMWTGIRDRDRRRLAGAKAQGIAPPTLLPHPDDIVICATDGVSFVGPLTEAELKDAKLTEAAMIAWLHQEALQKRQDGKRNDPSYEPHGPGWYALMANRVLPPSLKWSDSRFIDLRMRLAGVPMRELLKATRAAWKTAGFDMPRGRRIPPCATMNVLETMLREVLTEWRDADYDPKAFDAIVDEVVEKTQQHWN